MNKIILSLPRRRILNLVRNSVLMPTRNIKKKEKESNPSYKSPPKKCEKKPERKNESKNQNKKKPIGVIYF